MPTIRNIFKINGPVPFLDIEPHKDNGLFVDPCRIRLDTWASPHRAAAVQQMNTFLDLVARKIMANDVSGAFDLLKHFGEPNETRLGMSKLEIMGRGGGLEVGWSITEALSDELRPLLEVAILKYLENLPLFVAGVDRDITSDITTRIAFNALIDFTQAMMRRYPELGRQTRPDKYQIWDDQNLVWTTRTAELPLVYGAPLLLVPKQWAGTCLLMSYQRFHQTTVRGWGQEVHTTYFPNGRSFRPTKEQIEQMPGYKLSRETNLRITQHAYDNGVNLIQEFTDFVERRYEEPRSQAA